MGNFLDTPITDKDTDVGECSTTKLSFGTSSMQGWRAQMEDDHLSMLKFPEAPDISLFGVFDGHGGDLVAHHVAREFPRHFQQTKEFPTLTGNPADFEARAKAAFEHSVMSIDQEMRQLQEVESGQDQSGSTSVMVLVGPSCVVCANTGDSRAVMSRDGVAVALSEDHKPFNPEEKERIEAAGSHVKFNRVNGDLAVSRALGDFVYKRCESLPEENQAVTAFPEVMTERRDPEKDGFIVLACDGIWDVMSSQEVVDKVREMLQNGRPPQSDPPPGLPAAAASETLPRPQRPWDLGAVCEALIDHCLGLGSRDNMSVTIVIMQPSLKPKAENT